MYKELFPPGNLYFTAGVHNEIMCNPAFAEFVQNSLSRHIRGDWGDSCKEDREENELSLREGLRLLSAYKNDKHKIWIITEADRSATTILFPDEY